ncbi:MAG: TetR/AcrR family transcriptional regulator, partial [Alphaproteobacteria bacterium]|nr:TetR/AcrR family transcriptional regulator [Alphaproteobacteria bacterium]
MIEKKNTNRQLQAQNTKKKLFIAAMELFQKKGFYRTTISDITKLANTSKGSFYTHFKSKEHVIIEHFRQLDIFYSDFYHRNNISQHSLKTLKDFITELLLMVKNEIGFDLTFVIYDTQLKHREERNFVINENRSLYITLEQIIKGGQKKGEIRSDIDCHELCMMISRTFRGIFYDWCLYNNEWDLLEVGMSHFNVFLDGLKDKH